MITFRDYDKGAGEVKIVNFSNKEEAIKAYGNMYRNVYLAWKANKRYEVITDSLMSWDLHKVIDWSISENCEIEVFTNFEDVGYFLKDMNEGR